MSRVTFAQLTLGLINRHQNPGAAFTGSMYVVKLLSTFQGVFPGSALASAGTEYIRDVRGQV